MASKSIADRLGSLFDRDADATQHKGVAIAICVLISGFLWFSFAMQKEYTRMVEWPTTLVGLPDDQALTRTPPHTVRVQVAGEGIQLLQLYYNPPTLVIDAQEDEVNLEAIAPDLAKNVRLESVQPQTVYLAKEPRVTRRIPIASRVQIETPAGHALVGAVRLTPDSVEVTGARSIVEGLTAWPTRRLRFEDQRDPLRVQVALSDTLSDLVVRSVDNTRLTAQVSQFTEHHRRLPVVVEGIPSNDIEVQLTPAFVHVSYNVPLDQLDLAQQSPDFRATVDYSTIEEDTLGFVRPTLHRPEGITLLNVHIDEPLLEYWIKGQ